MLTSPTRTCKLATRPNDKMGSLEWSCVSLALLLLYCAVPIASQGCPAPSEDVIITGLRTLLPGASNPSVTITLNDYHFTCLGGVQSRNRYALCLSLYSYCAMIYRSVFFSIVTDFCQW